MTMVSPRTGAMAIPRSFSSIFLLIAGMALLLVVSFWVLVDPPVDSGTFGHLLEPERPIASAISPSSSDVIKTVHEEEADNKAKSVNISRSTCSCFFNDSRSTESDVSDLINSKCLPPSLLPDFNTSDKLDSGSCDLYKGKWSYDPSGPLYTSSTCPIITQMQNCQGNGRSDKGYENWRWKPDECDLPRFDAREFLQLMRGKTLAFVGDSVARNQMESMICILWQVEVPINRGNSHMQRWYFNSSSVTIVRIWSSWLVHQTTEFTESAKGIVNVHLDMPDEKFMDLLPNFDVLIISSGHWFAKQSAYILNNKVVGGQLWWPDKTREMEIDNIEAFGISVETILSAIVTHPNYTGLTIVRSFSPDHYEGGGWNTGGSCTGKTEPATEIIRNKFTDVMHEKQVRGFQQALTEPKRNGSKLKFMDITDVFAFRHDGHPGPYRSTDPNKVTKRGPNGQPPPQDCLHWCMPGPVDTWNEFLMEIMRREFEGCESESNTWKGSLKDAGGQQNSSDRNNYWYVCQ